MWLEYKLPRKEKQPQNGILNYNTILQLDPFCKHQQKWTEIPYVQTFMALYKILAFGGSRESQTS